jgi:hypothetical protein
MNMANFTEKEKEIITRHINECIGKIHNDIVNVTARCKECGETWDEPLDGDQTEWIAGLFHLQLDLINGNLTDAEFQKKIKKLR